MEELKYHYKYPHPSVTTDCVIFGFDGTKLRVLLVERGIEPYKGRWAFPGSFLKMDESAETGALRELQDVTFDNQTREDYAKSVNKSKNLETFCICLTFFTTFAAC